MKHLFACKYFTIIISILFISLPSIQSQTNDVHISEPKIEVLTVNNPNTFKVDLPESNYEQTFYFKITPTQYEPYPSCGYVPSRILSSPAHSYATSDAWAASGDFHMDHWTTGTFTYIFAAKSTSFELYATSGSFSVPINLGGIFFGTIPMSPAFMAIDRVNNYLYLADDGILVSYDLVNFHNTMNVATPPTAGPPMTHDATGGAGISVPNCVRVKIYNQKIFFVTKDFVMVYALTSTGDIELTSPAPIAFDTDFLNGPSSGLNLDLKDIGFNGDLAFILDNQLGVYTVNINTNVVDTNLRVERKRGEFLAVTSNSLIILTATTSIIYEYFFIGSPITDIEFNRHILSGFGNEKILQVDSDDNFLYLALEGQYPLVIRHSIPTRFEPLVYHNEEYMLFMGPYHSTKLLTSSTTDATSSVLFMDKALIVTWDTKLSKPYLQCQANSLPGCKYLLNVQGAKRKCIAQTSTNPNDVCLIDRELEITVLNSPRNCHIPGSAAPTGLALSPNAVFQNIPNLASKSDIDMNSSEETTKSDIDINLRPDLPTYETNIPSKGPYKPEKSGLESHNEPITQNDENNQDNKLNTKEDNQKTITLPRDSHHEPTKEKTREHVSTETANQNLQRDHQRNHSNTQTNQKEKEHFMKHTDPSHKYESDFTLSDSSQDSAIMATVNENNSFMNGLIIGLMVALIVLLIFAIFAFWWCGKERYEIEEKENSFEEDKSELEIKPEDKQNAKKEHNHITQILSTFGDESKVYVGTDMTQIDINEKSFN